VAIHDISSVVGATIGYGPEALETATAVKLSRTLWIVPLVAGMVLARRNRAGGVELDGVVDHGSDGRAGAKKLRIEFPWFILYFLLASLARTCIPGVAERSAQIGSLARGGMTVVLCLIGAGVSLESLRSVGWKAPVQGTLLWVFISLVSLVVILCNIALGEMLEVILAEALTRST